MVSKDQSIITQVAAKIAADLTPKTDDIMTNISNWVIAFEATTDALLEVHGMSKQANDAPQTTEEAMQVIQSAFPDAQFVPASQYSQPQQYQQEAPTTGFQVRIKGKQHGPIPAWLNEECAKVGVTEVWDNRDGLAANPKRPWFKAVNGDKAFWEPRKRK